MAISEDIVVHAAQKHWAAGEFGPCLMVVWRGAPAEEDVRQINTWIGKLTQRLPGKCVYINVIEPKSPAPSSAARKLAMEGLSRPGLACKVAVIEGNELRAALVRAILTGMALLRREEQPTKWFKNTREMSLWVKDQLQAAGDLDQQIVQAAEVIRNQMPTS
jgi:hypothetical protein